MSKELNFEGGSDDTFGDISRGGVDFCNNGADEPITFQVKSGDEGFNVFGYYGKNGCWVVGLQQIDENTPIPGWPIMIKNGECGYSTRLIARVPDDATVTCLNN